MTSPNRYASAWTDSSASHSTTIGTAGRRSATGIESADSVFNAAMAAMPPASARSRVALRRSTDVRLGIPFHRSGMNRALLIKAAKVIGTWLPAVLLVLIFVPQGLAKFNDSSGWARAFRLWGYPDWFRITIGALELLAAALLIAGRTAAFGAITIIVIMLGGTATHLIFEGGRHMTSEIVPLTLATIVLVIRKSQVLS